MVKKDVEYVLFETSDFEEGVIYDSETALEERFAEIDDDGNEVEDCVVYELGTEYSVEVEKGTPKFKLVEVE